MKKFVIHYNYYATADVTVLANSKEEAIEKADQIEIPNDEFDLEYDNREAFELEDVPDLQLNLKTFANIHHQAFIGIIIEVLDGILVLNHFVTIPAIGSNGWIAWN